MEQLLENVCLLLASRTRDVVKSALGFIKVAVVVMDVVHLAKHVQLVVRLHCVHWGARMDSAGGTLGILVQSVFTTL